MIIQDREGITSARRRVEPALEVHLPQIIRLRMLEALPRDMLEALFRKDATVAFQNAVDRARWRNLECSDVLKASMQFARAPMRLVAQRENDLLDLRRRLGRRRGVPAG